MPIRIECRCGKVFTVKERYAGKTTRCSECRCLLTIPLPDGVEVEEVPYEEAREETVVRPRPERVPRSKIGDESKGRDEGKEEATRPVGARRETSISRGVRGELDTQRVPPPPRGAGDPELTGLLRDLGEEAPPEVCRSCKAKLTLETPVCGSCGYDFRRRRGEPSFPAPSRFLRRLMQIAGAGILVLVALGFGIQVFSGRTPETPEKSPPAETSEAPAALVPQNAESQLRLELIARKGTDLPAVAAQIAALGKDALGVLEEAARHSEEEVRLAALRGSRLLAVAKIWDQKLLGLLRQGLADGSIAVASLAASALYLLAMEKIAPEEIPDLASELVRFTGLPSSGPCPDALRILADHGLREAREAVKYTCLVLLVRAGQHRYTAELLMGLSSKDLEAQRFVRSSLMDITGRLFVSYDPEALMWWETSSQKPRIEWLIDALGQRDDRLLSIATRELSKLTGQTWRYHPQMGDLAKRQICRQWLSWWELNRGRHQR